MEKLSLVALSLAVLRNRTDDSPQLTGDLLPIRGCKVQQSWIPGSFGRLSSAVGEAQKRLQS